jgi:hypothetical protein
MRHAYSEFYANGCTLGFYRCLAYANYDADVNDNADTRSGESLYLAYVNPSADTRSGESLCHAETCSDEYFCSERTSSECSCK